MKTLIISLLLLLSGVSEETQNPLCPGDSCMLMWQYLDPCVGTTCKAVDVYYCTCCSLQFLFYRN